MAQGQRDPVREQQWRERVADWQTSGLSVRAFCRRQGLAEPTFHYWRRELRARDEAAGSAQRTAAKRPPATSSRLTFVPVTMLASATLAVEVRCPSGHVVCLPECDAASLASLFAALNPPASEEPSC
jgi:transposase-like protein